MVQLSPCNYQPKGGDNYTLLQSEPSLRSFCSVHLLQYMNFVLQVKNVENEVTDRCVQTFDARFHVT